MPAPRPLLPVDVALVPSHKYSTKLVSAAVSMLWITTPESGNGKAARAGATCPAALAALLFAETTTTTNHWTGYSHGSISGTLHQTLRIFSRMDALGSGLSSE